MKTSALQSGLLAIRRGFESLAKHANQVANISSPDSEVSLEEPLIGIKRDKLAIQAGAAVIKTVQET